MHETLQQKIERLIGDFDEPFNFRNVLYSTLERVFIAAGSPSSLPDYDPSAFHAAIAAFVEGMVERLGLGLVVRVVVVHDANYWREIYRVTVFRDEMTDTYVLQVFEHQDLLAVARVGRGAVDWGYPLPPGSPAQTAFHGFVLGIGRGVPVVPPPAYAAETDGEEISIDF